MTQGQKRPDCILVPSLVWPWRCVSKVKALITSIEAQEIVLTKEPIKEEHWLEIVVFLAQECSPSVSSCSLADKEQIREAT